VRLIPLALLALCLAAPAARGQAWTQEPGRTFAKVTLGLASTSERYDFDGTAIPYDARLAEDGPTPFRDRSVYLYVEHGLAEALTLVGVLPFKRLAVQDAVGGAPVEREAADLGTAGLALRIGLAERVGLSDRQALSATLGVWAPLGYRRNVAPAVGPGQVDAELLLAFGQSFWPVAGYAQAAAGYRYRTGIYALSRRAECPPGTAPAGEPVCVPSQMDLRYSDELIGSVEAGYTLLGRLLVQAMADAAWSVDRPEPVALAGGVVQPEGFPQRRVIRVGGGLALTLFDDTALSVQAFTPAYARNALRATEWFFGLQTRF